MSSSRESRTIESAGGVSLDARVYPAAAGDSDSDSEHRNYGLVAVLVHPYSVLGGFQGLMKGIAAGLADRGVTAVTFNMRGVGKSTGRASLTGFAEVDDVVSVCKWASQNLSARRILLVGSSAVNSRRLHPSTAAFGCAPCLSLLLSNYPCFRISLLLGGFTAVLAVTAAAIDHSRPAAADHHRQQPASHRHPPSLGGLPTDSSTMEENQPLSALSALSAAARDSHRHLPGHHKSYPIVPETTGRLRLSLPLGLSLPRPLTVTELTTPSTTSSPQSCMK